MGTSKNSLVFMTKAIFRATLTIAVLVARDETGKINRAQYK